MYSEIIEVSDIVHLECPMVLWLNHLGWVSLDKKMEKQIVFRDVVTGFNKLCPETLWLTYMWKSDRKYTVQVQQIIWQNFRYEERMQRCQGLGNKALGFRPWEVRKSK